MGLDGNWRVSCTEGTVWQNIGGGDNTHYLALTVFIGVYRALFCPENQGKIVGAQYTPIPAPSFEYCADIYRAQYTRV